MGSGGGEAEGLPGEGGTGPGEGSGDWEGYDDPEVDGEGLPEEGGGGGVVPSSEGLRGPQARPPWVGGGTPRRSGSGGPSNSPRGGSPYTFPTPPGHPDT
jgi:hypothetical protein